MLFIAEGIYYFFKTVFCIKLLEILFGIKYGRKKWQLSFLAIGTSIFHSINVYITENDFSNSELLLIIIFTSAYAGYFLAGRIAEIIGLVWLYYVIVQLLEFFVITICSMGNLTNRIARLGVLIILHVVLYLGGKRGIRKHKKIHINVLILFIFDLIFSFLIVFFQRVYLEPITQYILNAWKIIGVYTLFLVGIFVLYEYGSYQLRKYKMIKEKNKMLEQNYHDILNIYKENARLFHDFYAHMNVIKKYLQENDKSKCISYVDNILKPGEELRKIAWTNCEIIDLILNLKRREAEEKGIVIHVESDRINRIEIPDIDLCAIFSNLIDNAIENCVPDKEIEIFIKKRNEMLLFSIKNPIVNAPVLQNKKLLTTKKDKMRHGIGIDSVQHSVDKHNGNFEYFIQNNYFEAIVTLPI